MKHRISLYLFSLVVITVFGGPASGQTVTSRVSTLNYNYVYGGGADSHVGGDNISDSTLLTSDIEGTEFTGSDSDVIPGDPPQPWGASVSVDLDHDYAIGGPLTAFHSITASASTQVAAAASGAGTAVMHSQGPGNEIVFSFTLDSPRDYHLVGNLVHPAPGAFSYIAIQWFNGFNWQYIFWSAALPNGQGPFDLSGTLLPGEYQLQCVLGLTAGGNESSTATYQYELNILNRGDMNCDGLVDGRDIQPFLIAVQDPGAYATSYFSCDILNGDMDGNTTVDEFDVPGFVNRLLNGG
ncbi:MAG: hypothetical protein AABZ08_00065 [Planctomycetota bacterium]